MTIELDALFKEVRQAKRAQDRSKEAIKASAPPPDPRAIWTSPENWTRTRGIALIHAETQTLLGQFSEYIHRSVPNARRLVRESVPIEVSGSETVSGSWWLAEDRKPEPRQEWHTQRHAIIHLHLDALRVRAPATEVVVHLSFGGVARVELALDTMFAQESGKQEQLLHLPAGTDVLPVMSLDSKIALRVEIGS